MELSTRYRRGQVRGDGLVFLCYDKTSQNGQRWGTAADLLALRERARRTAAGYRKTERSRSWITAYRSRDDVRERRNASRRLGIGRGRGLRKNSRSPEYWKQYNLAWKTSQRRANRLFALKANLRGRLWACAKGLRTQSVTLERAIGCTAEEFRDHIQAQFKHGMSWDNYSPDGWHVDHVIPLARARSQSELLSLFHYTNARPLWAPENLRKWAR
jgi:hypothetical protein